ncbi:hypothetical protein [Streptomyces omiyaensis]|uniref:hypothetical protein n=1 Tax=Streptomyces omiyaensis TaxID=68247 RepID=UPI0036FECB49
MRRTAGRFHRAHRPAVGSAALRRARGRAVFRALGGLLIGEAGRLGGKPRRGPPAALALRRPVASARGGSAGSRPDAVGRARAPDRTERKR